MRNESAGTDIANFFGGLQTELIEAREKRMLAEEQTAMSAYGKEQAKLTAAIRQAKKAGNTSEVERLQKRREELKKKVAKRRQMLKGLGKRKDESLDAELLEKKEASSPEAEKMQKEMDSIDDWFRRNVPKYAYEKVQDAKSKLWDEAKLAMKEAMSGIDPIYKAKREKIEPEEFRDWTEEEGRAVEELDDWYDKERSKVWDKMVRRYVPKILRYFQREKARWEKILARKKESNKTRSVKEALQESWQSGGGYF